MTDRTVLDLLASSGENTEKQVAAGKQTQVLNHWLNLQSWSAYKEINIVFILQQW